MGAIQARCFPGTQVGRGENNALSTQHCPVDQVIVPDLLDQSQGIITVAQPKRAGFYDGFAGFQQAAANEFALFICRDSRKAKPDIDLACMSGAILNKNQAPSDAQADGMQQR